MKRRLRSRDRFTQRLLRQAGAGRGKRLRARLTLLSARAAGGAGQRAEPLAAALELLHQATLLHDDVIDASDRRRHRTTVNARFGNQAAVLAGDLVLAQALELLAGDLPPDVRRLVARTATRVCRGELRELAVRGDSRLDEAGYLAMIRDKTASLLETCCAGGARMVGAQPWVVGALAAYGRNFGLAFQIQDDLLDVIGSPGRVGKSLHQDLRAGHPTLPVIYGLRLAPVRERRLLRRVLTGEPALPDRVRRILDDCGALAKTRGLAETMTRRARAALAPLPPTAAVRALSEMADFAADRDH